MTNMQVVEVGADCNATYEHTFCKNPLSPASNLILSGISENNYVIISTDSRPGVASGFVTDVTSATITACLDR